MHLVLANQWYPPESGWGGVAMYNYAVANAYRALGHQVTILARRNQSTTAAHTETNGVRIQRLLTRDHYRLRRIPLAKKYARTVQQMYYSWRVRQALIELQRAQPIDMIEFAEVNAEGYWTARALNLPFVVRCHTPTFVLKKYFEPAEMPYDTNIIAACEKDVLRRAAGLTAPSHDLARVIADACALACDSIRVVPNPLPSEFLQLPVQPLSPRADSFQLLYVGRFERVKGIGVLAAAIPQVVRQFPKAHFLFAGYDRPTVRGTSQQAELEQQLAQAGVRDNVEFLGAVEQTQLPALYQAADVCIVPSLLYESFSYTCAQAMAMARPVIASRIGGISETVEHGDTGLLFTPGDAQELAAAIRELAENPARCAEMGHAGRVKASREFDPLRVAEQNLQVYERARRGKQLSS